MEYPQLEGMIPQAGLQESGHRIDPKLEMLKRRALETLLAVADSWNPGDLIVPGRWNLEGDTVECWFEVVEDNLTLESSSYRMNTRVILPLQIYHKAAPKVSCAAQPLRLYEKGR